MYQYCLLHTTNCYIFVHYYFFSTTQGLKEYCVLWKCLVIFFAWSLSIHCYVKSYLGLSNGLRSYRTFFSKLEPCFELISIPKKLKRRKRDSLLTSHRCIFMPQKIQQDRKVKLVIAAHYKSTVSPLLRPLEGGWGLIYFKRAG